MATLMRMGLKLLRVGKKLTNNIQCCCAQIQALSLFPTTQSLRLTITSPDLQFAPDQSPEQIVRVSDLRELAIWSVPVLPQPAAVIRVLLGVSDRGGMPLQFELSADGETASGEFTVLSYFPFHATASVLHFDLELTQ
jgi:hypothetical protein